MNRHLWFVLLLLPLGCNDPCNNKKEEPLPAKTADEPTTFDISLLEIASSYEGYGLADPEGHLALLNCAFVAPTLPPRFSGGGDTATHGQKLYWLFVKQYPQDAARGAYTVAGKANPVGQAVVKEAWEPAEAKEGEKMPDHPEHEHLKRRSRSTGPVRNDGREYHAGKKTGLFIMFKMDPVTPGTDEGWVYGTVTADGKTVTSVGKVESCMGCHRKAPYDRLFGMHKE